MNLKYGWLANLPSSYQRRCSAQSPIDVSVLGRLIKKSPVPYGKSAGNERVKKNTAL
jgi:hypothetical protein